MAAAGPQPSEEKELQECPRPAQGDAGTSAPLAHSGSMVGGAQAVEPVLTQRVTQASQALWRLPMYAQPGQVMQPHMLQMDGGAALQFSPLNQAYVAPSQMVWKEGEGPQSPKTVGSQKDALAEGDSTTTQKPTSEPAPEAQAVEVQATADSKSVAACDMRFAQNVGASCTHAISYPVYPPQYAYPPHPYPTYGPFAPFGPFPAQPHAAFPPLPYGIYPACASHIGPNGCCPYPLPEAFGWKKELSAPNPAPSVRKRAMELKKRFRWTQAMHTCFQEVVGELGLDEAKPQAILDMLLPRLEQQEIGCPELPNRHHIKSHLQKHRLRQKPVGALKANQGLILGSTRVSEVTEPAPHALVEATVA